jgi:hypothetical protein
VKDLSELLDTDRGDDPDPSDDPAAGSGDG